MKKALVITGPTATGKSALAAQTALHYGGRVLNADSMQMYRGIPILSSAPCLTKDDAPHDLYGVWDPCFYGSVRKWGELLRDRIDCCVEEGEIPIICGGTGLYLDFLLKGYHYVPDISSSIMEALQEELRHNGIEKMYQRLQYVDPEGAGFIKPRDRQRVIRRLSVFDETGRTLSAWQKEEKINPFKDFNFFVVMVCPPRETTYKRCDTRIDKMIAHGAVNEVSQLMKECRDTKAPIWGALGVKSLASFVLGETSLENAVEEFKTLTRRYAKRQMTWFRHQLFADEVLPYAILDEECAKNQDFFKKVERFLAT